VLLAAAALAWLVNMALDAYPRRLFAAGLVYFGLAGCASLLSAVLYMLKQYVGMLAATVVGIAVVGVVLHHTGVGIYGSHWIGLSATIAVQAGWAAGVLARRAARTKPELRVARLPSSWSLAALVAPYAAYGACITRSSSSTGSRPGRPRPTAFRSGSARSTRSRSIGR
jgi:uncharacterized membrane protein YgcG